MMETQKIINSGGTNDPLWRQRVEKVIRTQDLWWREGKTQEVEADLEKEGKKISRI